MNIPGRPGGFRRTNPAPDRAPRLTSLRTSFRTSVAHQANGGSPPQAAAAWRLRGLAQWAPQSPSRCIASALYSTELIFYVFGIWRTLHPSLSSPTPGSVKGELSERVGRWVAKAAAKARSSPTWSNRQKINTVCTLCSVAGGLKGMMLTARGVAGTSRPVGMMRGNYSYPVCARSFPCPATPFLRCHDTCDSEVQQNFTLHANLPFSRASHQAYPTHLCLPPPSPAALRAPSTTPRP